MLNLLQPEVERITPTEHKPTHDHAPEELALGTPLWLRDDLVELLGGEQVHSRLIDLVKYATDASAYRMFPKVVVSPRTVDDVAKIFAYTRAKKLPVTIRAAGSSLSGQSQGDGILIDARKHWAGVTVEEGGNESGQGRLCFGQISRFSRMGIGSGLILPARASPP
jgi:D-lactate dehydrogenase